MMAQMYAFVASIYLFIAGVVPAFIARGGAAFIARGVRSSQGGCVHRKGGCVRRKGAAFIARGACVAGACIVLVGRAQLKR